MASHQQIAHRWAQMNSRLDVSGYAMFADGHTIYSWGRHFRIAAWVPTTATEATRVAQGVPAMCVFFNADGYSASTAKHKSIVRRAIPSRAWTFTVPSAFWEFPDQALPYYEERARECLSAASRARTTAEYHVSEANRLLNEAQNLALAFRLKWTRPDVSELETRAAKRAKAQERAAKQAAKRRREAEELARVQAVAQMDEWLRGEHNRVPSHWRTAPDGSAYIRRSPDGESLQTSMGADVPWQHAVKAFRFIKLCRERGEAFKSNGRVIRVGHFSVDEIDVHGNMKAGCHLFAWSEIERLAKAAGVFDAAPSAEAVETR